MWWWRRGWADRYQASRTTYGATLPRLNLPNRLIDLLTQINLTALACQLYKTPLLWQQPALG